MISTTVLDHRPPRKDDCEARRDAVNRMPPSPMPAAGRSITSTIVTRDLPADARRAYIRRPPQHQLSTPLDLPHSPDPSSTSPRSNLVRASRIRSRSSAGSRRSRSKVELELPTTPGAATTTDRLAVLVSFFCATPRSSPASGSSPDPLPLSPLGLAPLSACRAPR